jgi:hypothetical protein
MFAGGATAPVVQSYRGIEPTQGVLQGPDAHPMPTGIGGKASFGNKVANNLLQNRR